MSTESNTELLNKLKIEDEVPEGPSKNTMVLVGIVCSVLIVCVLVIVWLFMGEDGPDLSVSSTFAPSESVKSTAETPEEKRPLIVSNPALLNASGYVVARVRATVSAEILGRINTVLVEEGMRVERGQILAELDSTIAEVEFELSKAQVLATEERLAALVSERDEAKRILQRLIKLDKDQFTSESTLTRARANLATREAEIRATKAELLVSELAAKRQEEFLARHILRAPFSGVVTVKNAQPGEIISPSSAGGGFTRTGICTVVDMESLEIEVDVSESYIGRVFRNQKVVAKLDAYPDWEIPAKVIAVIPTADRAKATVRVRIAFLKNDSKILPEMGAKVAFFDDAIKEDDIND